MTTPLRIGVPACFFHHDPTRPIFKGKRLVYFEESMLHYLMRNGALPVLLPAPHGEIQNDSLLAEVDGLLLQGGSDVCPASYGEEPLRPEWNGDLFRDEYEIALIHACLAANKPVLGICRGHQILNVALGGDLYQDTETQLPGTLVHRDWEPYDRLHHEIAIAGDSQLAALFANHSQATRDTASGDLRATIISIHHQAIRRVAPALSVEASSVEDGIVEAVRLTDASALPQKVGGKVDQPYAVGSQDMYAVGVQWHPEFQRAGEDEHLLPADPLMAEFLGECQRRKS